MVKHIRTYLLHYLRLYGTSRDNYWIDVNPIGFKSGKDKFAWRTGWDTADLHTFADFLKDPIWGKEKAETFPLWLLLHISKVGRYWK